ncbi:MAG: MerR family DNA-binding protein [Actinobacteria bacterium]|nr:MerR family DNA-binding protein [Actinomycetota bacterium]
MLIGELAARTQVPAKTIRYYEEVRLMAPPARAPNRYRDFDQPAVERLKFIRGAQSLGFGLGEIREIIAYRDRGETPCAHVLDLIQRRSRELVERIDELRRSQKELEKLARRARRLSPKDCEPSQICHLLAPAGSD